MKYENKLGQGLSPDIIRTIKTFCKPIHVSLKAVFGDRETSQYNDDNIIDVNLYMFTYEDAKYLYVDIEGVTAFIFFINEESFISELIRKIMETIEYWYMDDDTSVFFRGSDIMVKITLLDNVFTKIMLNTDQRGKRSIDITDLVRIEKFPDSVENEVKIEEKPGEYEVEFIDTI